MQIIKTTPITKITFKQHQSVANICYAKDETTFENPNLNKKVLIDRGIIPQNKNINSFFDEISTKIFPNSKKSSTFSNMLKEGYISLSSSCYMDLANPKSAIGVVLNPKEPTAKHLAQLEEYIKSGCGIGINFSEFENPTKKIKEINSYFKYREKTTKRHPAGIGLLNIDHPQILDFISLKDNENYKDWCFDLSVVMPNDFLTKVENNNTITLTDGRKISAREIYARLLNSMLKKGEPGIIFSNKKNYICDCCAATELQENEGLTLGQINLSKFYNPKTNKVDYDNMQNCAEMLSLAMKTIDKNSYIGILGYKTLLDKMNIVYGSQKAKEILECSLKTISTTAHVNNLKIALSPTGTISRLLNATPSIEPVDNQNINYFDEIDTMAVAQKYCDGNISKTILLKEKHSIEDIDSIIRYCQQKNIKGISVFPKNNKTT